MSVVHFNQRNMRHWTTEFLNLDKIIHADADAYVIMMLERHNTAANTCSNRLTLKTSCGQ